MTPRGLSPNIGLGAVTDMGEPGRETGWGARSGHSRSSHAPRLRTEKAPGFANTHISPAQCVSQVCASEGSGLAWRSSGGFSDSSQTPTRVLSLFSSCLTDQHLPCLGSCKGPGRNVDVTRAYPDTQGRRRRPDRGARGGQVFYNSEYGELAGPQDEGDCPPSARTPFFTDDSY